MTTESKEVRRAYYEDTNHQITVAFYKIIIEPYH